MEENLFRSKIVTELLKFDENEIVVYDGFRNAKRSVLNLMKYAEDTKVYGGWFELEDGTFLKLVKL